MKKIFITFLVAVGFLASAGSSFAATIPVVVSDLTYDTSTHELSFTTSVDLSSASLNTIEIRDLSNIEYMNSLSFTCDSNSCAASMTETQAFPPSGNVRIFLESWSQNNLYLSQFVSYPFPTPTVEPTPAPEVKIVASPDSGSKTVGTPFTVNVAVNSTEQEFNAARSTVSVSSNLTVNSISAPTSNACNLQYTQTPTKNNPSFAGAIYGGSSTNCNVYIMVVTPNNSGTGTIAFTNNSVKSYADGSEILTGVQNGSFTISGSGVTPTPTPAGGALVSIDDSIQGSGQNQWNYNGGWSHCTDSSNPACNPSSVYNTSVSWTAGTNDYATVTFTGTQISLYGLVDPNHGTGAVSIDNGAETTVDFNAATRTGNVLLWTSPTLAYGEHTFKLRVDNGYIAPDRVSVMQNAPLPVTVSNTSFDTYGSSFTLLGTRESTLTSIFVNSSADNTTYPTSTTWQSVQSVVLGSNAFTIYGSDGSNQTASLNVTVNRHILGDINGDNVIDLIDASLFAVDWDKTESLTYNLSDMNDDGVVDLTDLSILAKLQG